MAIKNSLMFGGISSADYGIFISGEGVFNSPSRAVEMVSVPGRNGAIAIDLGRYENISIEYPIFVSGSSKKGFRSKLSSFINAISSQRGYQRLTDTYHPDEYRMALFVEQVEVEPVHYNTAGGAKLVFNCKPQRFLLSGEEEVPVSSGDKLINPTLHDASPLLAVMGYGTIGLNGHEIEVDQGLYGDIVLAQSGSVNNSTEWFPDISKYFRIDTTGIFNPGDTITLKGGTRINSFDVFPSSVNDTIDSITSVADSNNLFSTTWSKASNKRCLCTTSFGDISFVYGTDSTVTNTTSFTIKHQPSRDDIVDIKIEFKYYASSDLIYITTSRTRNEGNTGIKNASVSWGDIIGASTKSYLGHPTYIDCDLGEAYSLDSGSLVSLNAYIDLGSDLPKLAPGENTITKDNTITELTINPRWWQI